MNTTENNIDFEWIPESSRFENYNGLLAAFKEKHGTCQVPKNYMMDGKKLGFWFSKLQKARSQGRLSVDMIKKLDELGFVWTINETEIVTPKTRKITIELAESDFVNDRYQLPVEVLLPDNKVEHLTLTLTKEGDINFE